MKQRLLDEREQLVAELAQDANSPAYGRHEDENASEVADATALTATTDALAKRLEEVNGALIRIDSGAYGITSEGDVIPENRLRANPAAINLIKK